MKPPTRIHVRLSRRAGSVVTLATGASFPVSIREFTDGFWESSLGAPPAAAPSCAAAGGGAVPETETDTGVFAATESRVYALNPCACPAAMNPLAETCIDGGAKTPRCSTAYCEA